MIKKKIGWQKYEDYIEQQLSSPILINIIQNIATQQMEQLVGEEIEGDENTQYITQSAPITPMTNQLLEDITILSTFDCWIGHTNFDITNSIKETLDVVQGVEVLKICSRYRFFVGIGQMFDFKNVRNEIEKAIIKGDFDNGRRLR